MVCAGIIPCSTEKLLSGENYGELNDDGRKCIWDILESTATLATEAESIGMPSGSVRDARLSLNNHIELAIMGHGCLHVLPCP